MRRAESGEIVVDVKLENPGDCAALERGDGRESDIRRTAVQVSMPSSTVGLPCRLCPGTSSSGSESPPIGIAIVTYADERKEERPVAGPLTIHLGDRLMNTDCIVGPPLGKPLAGRVVLEALDLLPDCANRVLARRPGSPDHPLPDLRSGPEIRT